MDDRLAEAKALSTTRYERDHTQAQALALVDIAESLRAIKQYVTSPPILLDGVSL